MFEKDRIYNRRSDLHQVYGGQMQGGISTPAKHDFIMLFASPTGEQHGYRDGWKDGSFFYTGEGQLGDMQFVRGNLAIRDHAQNAKHLHLFEYVSSGSVRYVDELVYVRHEIRTGTDAQGMVRKIIVFQLRPVR